MRARERSSRPTGLAALDPSVTRFPCLEDRATLAVYNRSAQVANLLPRIADIFSVEIQVRRDYRKPTPKSSAPAVIYST